MVRWYYDYRIGDVYARCGDGKVRKANIFGGNCLCVFTHIYKDEKTGKKMENFLNFYNDEQHIKNIMRHEGKITPIDNITKVRLNIYYEEAKTLLPYFAKSGYKVEVYYKEPKTKKGTKK